MSHIKINKLIRKVNNNNVSTQDKKNIYINKMMICCNI